MSRRKRPTYPGDSSSQQYCQGYLDGNDQWNTGFFCPSSGDARVACCGNETYKYCCATATTTIRPSSIPTHQTHHLTTPDIISVSVTSLGVAVCTVCLLTLCAIIIFVVLNRRGKYPSFSPPETGHQDDDKTTVLDVVFTISTAAGIQPQSGATNRLPKVPTFTIKYWHKIKQLIRQYLTQLNVI